MAMPKSQAAKKFYRAAFQRWDEATVLMNAKRTTGAVYLAGYTVECMLKALILAATPEKDHAAVVLSFRGVWAHSFDELRYRYRKADGPRFPANIHKSFVRVSTWSPHRRYATDQVRLPDAAEFLASVKRILEWADGRL